ncbi:peptide ABC transporter substrate-binding protein [Oceaniovalibus guishaninsula JLT2003]|uniref:Peptide ABC transporter substrate-binding protein n=1 Tax=Oceaniovalibus guishaninsula JLT2003 TaxID=1231392 RepID=K2HD07_9RHOB|nr:extracellular solute-binding protein [Oceaniovalibus guishaninsula]EKE44467.1 peptide ABC transporter substrate-binding protein [Oceaniovalibus guishaninsula JLT2003]
MNDRPRPPLRRLLTGLAAALALAGPGVAQDDAAIVTAHAYSDLGGIKYPPDFAHLDYVNPDAPKGGEMATWARGTFDSMNPYSRKGRSPAFSVLPYERIMTTTDDDAYASYCLLCETLEYPETLDWVIFNLRDDVTFSDGTPMTAEDVVFTYNLFIEQGFSSFAAAVSQMFDKVEALGPHRVKFTFNPDLPRKGMISQAGASIVFQKKWFEETGARLDESRLTQPPGTGPYMITQVEVPRRIVATRNPDYWGADLPINRGRWNFDTLRVEFFADTNAALEGFKAGVYTFRQETSSIAWATQYDFPGIDSGAIVKAELPDGSLPVASGFVFNLRKPKLQDVRVRRALGLMYNGTWTNDTLQYALFEQRESFWQNSDLQAKGVPEGRELELLQTLGDGIDDAILTEPAVLPHESGDRQLDRGNLREASALLQDAGWIAGDDGLRRKDGEVLTIEFIENNPSFDRIILPYIDNLKRLGVDARYNRIDDAQYTSRVRDHDFDMIFDGYTNGLEEALGIGQRYGCEDRDDVFNPAGYCNPAVDELIERLVETDTLEDMQAAVRGIDRIMRADYFMVPVWYNPRYWVAYYDIFDYPEPLPPYGLGNLDFWWYLDEKAEALKASGAL